MRQPDGGEGGPGEATPSRADAPSKDPAPTKEPIRIDCTASSGGRRAQLPTVAAEDNGWLGLLIAAFARRAKRPGSFTTFDVAREAELPEPRHPNLWGTGTGIARREGIIVPVAATESLRPKTAKSLVRLWVGARYAEDGEAA